jgi:hypothetical protein
MLSQIANSMQLSNMSTDELKRELGRGLSITADYLRYLATVWQELSVRSVDVSDLRHGLMEYLPAIANKMVHPELVINYAGKRTLLTALSRLPYETQDGLVSSGHVTISKIDGEQHQEVQMSLLDMTAADVYRVFGDGYIRTPAEQYKQALMLAKPRKALLRKTNNVKIDKDTGMVKISNKTVDPKLLITVLSEMYGIDLHKVIGKGA